MKSVKELKTTFYSTDGSRNENLNQYKTKYKSS